MERKLQIKYSVLFALKHREELAKLNEGKVLGKESKGWRNVSEHCLLAGMMTETLGKLVGLSREDLANVVSVALTHDWDKRLIKELPETSRIVLPDGRIIVEQDINQEILHERREEGLVRVTGNDWRDFEGWGLAEKILRYADSSIGETPDGKATILNWQERIAKLKEKNPKMHQEEGSRLYDMPLYDKLEEITLTIERELYEIIIANNSDLLEKYPTHKSLVNMVRDTWQDDAVSFSSY